MPNESPEAAKAVAYCKKVVEASIRDALRPFEGAPVGTVIEVLKKNIQELLRVSLAEPSGRCVDLLLNFTNEGETIVPGDDNFSDQFSAIKFRRHAQAIL